MKKLYTLLLLFGLYGFSQNQISPLANGCAGLGFNLTMKNQELLAGQSANIIQISFFTSLVNAQNNTNLIQNVTSYQPPSGTNNMVFARLLNTQTQIVEIKFFSLQTVPPLIVAIQTFDNWTINAIGSGGTPPYQYSLNNGPFQNSGTFSNIPFGLYTVSVQDVNGCVAVASGVNQGITTNNIDAVNDFFTISNAIGTTSTTVSVLNNDTVDQQTVPPNGYYIQNFQMPAGISMNAAGIITVASTVASGTYTFNYQLCNMLIGQGMASCDTAMVSIVVNTPSIINAVDDGLSAEIFVTQSGGLTSSIINNDTLNGAPLTASPTISLGIVRINGNPMITNNVIFFVNNLGQIIVPGNLQAGVYTIQYTICQWSNPQSNCDSATVTFIVSDVLEFTINSTYVDLNADGFTNIGDKINYQLTVKNNGNLPLTNVIIGMNPAIFTPDNLVVTGSAIASLPAGASNSTNFTASHLLTQTNINNNFVTKHAVAKGNYNNNIIQTAKSNTKQLQLSNGLKLQAFLDTNGNGIKESTEPFFTNGNFNVSINGVQNAVTSSTGMYVSYESNPTVVYNLSYTITGEYAAQYTSASIYNNVSVPSNSGITTFNFPIVAVPFTDLKVMIVPNGTPPRPGFTYKNNIIIKNNGNLSIPAGTLTFTKNNVVSISSTVPATISNATGFTYNYPTIAAQAIVTIEVKMLVPTIPTVALGQTLTNLASVSVPTNDVNVNNNSNSLTQTIVGSYDPNDKNEARGPKIVYSTFTSNDYLTYTIQFENTGTFMAENVRVEDVLNTKLDETTVRMIASSHDYNLIRKNNQLTWRFDGIGLPPSVANTNIGHGYITFQVKPKAGFVLNDVIPNFANIYFDFNPPIVTNIFTTTFVQSLNSDNFESKVFVLYPNPTTAVLYLQDKNQISTIKSIEIFDLLGKKLLSQNENVSSIDVSGLTKGVYLMTIKTVDANESMRFVKQ